MYITPESVHSVPAFPVDAVDTVGAGDCYCGVLAASVAQGLDMKAAMRRACAAAAISHDPKGRPALHAPTAREIEDFLLRVR